MSDMGGWYKFGQGIAARREENTKNKIQDIEDAYQGLQRGIELYQGGDHDRAGAEMEKSLKTLGVIDKSATWTHEEDKDPDRIKLLANAVKMFNKGTSSGTQFYDDARAALGYMPKKLSNIQRKALTEAQTGSQERLGSQYLSTMLSPTDTGQGVANRLGLVNQTRPELSSQIGDITGLNTQALTDKAYAPYQADIGSYVAKSAPELLKGPLSDPAMSAQFAQDVPALATKALPELAKIDKKGTTGVHITDIPIKGKTHKAIVDNVGNIIKDFGETPGKDYKFGQDVIQDEDNNWWRIDPSSGRWQKWDNGKGNFVTSRTAPSETYGKTRKTMTAEQQKAMASYLTVKSDIDDVFKKMNVYEKKVGPVSGNYNKFAMYFKDDPDFKDVQMIQGMIESNILRAQSGLVVSDSERAFYEKNILPMLTNPKGNFKAGMQRLQKWITKQYNYNIKMGNISRTKMPGEMVDVINNENNPTPTQRTVTRTGTAKDGRKVIQYSDGSIEYAP